MRYRDRDGNTDRETDGQTDIQKERDRGGEKKLYNEREREREKRGGGGVGGVWLGGRRIGRQIGSEIYGRWTMRDSSRKKNPDR